MSPTLSLRDVRKSFGDFVAVDGVSLDVPKGKIFGFLGPNGAGKTTTIRMIMDIISPDSGEVHLFGRPRTLADLENIGYLPEERGLYRKMTVRDHLVFLARLHGRSKQSVLPRIHEWLVRLGIQDWEDRKVEELSKGMQQKIQLVGTILHEPEMLILDEPFSGLDPINQGLFKEMFSEYKAQGRTILFSTHVMEQAEKLCDHICLISHGRTLLQGELSEIKKDWGGNTYRLEASGNLDRVGEVPGVDQALVRDGTVRLLLEPDAQGSDVLKELVGFLEVSEFHSEAPDLEEIFVKAVGDAG